MAQPPKPLPRFLPTLTEVVQPVTMMPAGVTQPGDQDQLVERVFQRVETMLASRLRQTIESLVQEQAELLRLRLQQELSPLLREAVVKAVASEAGSPSAS